MSKRDVDDWADDNADVRTLQDKQYLGSWDLDGKDRVVTIVGLTNPRKIVGDGGKENKKAVLFIEEHEKGVVMNATNMNTIRAMYGNKVKDWKGKRVTLFVGRAQKPGTHEQCDAIRVRPKAPSAPVARKPGNPQLAAPVAIEAEFDEEREAIEAET